MLSERWAGAKEAAVVAGLVRARAQAFAGYNRGLLRFDGRCAHPVENSVDMCRETMEIQRI